MANIDKNQAIIDYLMNCPQIQNNPTFFNFTEAQDNNKSIVIVANDKAVNRPYIDGSVLKRFTFTIIDFRSVTYQALPKIAGYTNENVEELMDVQGIIDWIDTQNEAKNFPNFGDKCTIDSITTTTDNPNLNGVDSSMKPNLAKYSVSIRVEYLDNSKKIWS